MLHSTIRNTANVFCEIHHGDCRAVISENLNNWQGQYDLIFADPPFNIDHGYDLYYDDLDTNEFAAFMAEWIAYCSYCLRPGGVLAINIPDELVLLVLQTCKALELDRIAWVLWHYRFGQCNTSNWINSKVHCLIFSNSNEYTFNANAVLVESDRSSKYGDPRTLYAATPGKRLPFDIWGLESDGQFWGRVQGNNGERVDNHPNQLPEKYLERLIRAYTNAGDLILDPFGGTGTTATVAHTLQRNCVTIELSGDYCRDIEARVNKGALRVST